MFKLIANRLLRQFQEHNLQHASELFTGFGQWTAYASAAAGTNLGPVEAAVLRCSKVAAGVRKIAHLCPPDLPYLAGWYIDTHVPLLRAGCGSIYQMYQANLAPEQQGGFPVAVGPPFIPHEDLKLVLQTAWFPFDGSNAPSMLSKLLEKGTRPPISIRYIGPQCIRAMAEGAVGRTAITSMVVAHSLRAYPHCRASTIVWDVRKRAKVYAEATPDGIRNIIATKTARQLFSAVCEYTVALTSQHTSLWRAVSCVQGGLAHIRNVQQDAGYAKGRSSKLAKTATRAYPASSRSKAKKMGARSKIPSDVTKECDPVKLRNALLATSIDNTMAAEPKLTRKVAADIRLFAARHQAPLRCSPLSENVADIQREAVCKATGVPELLVAICKTCTVLHRKVKNAPPPIKKRSGVSAQLGGSGLLPGRCAACGTEESAVIVDAVGLEIRARVRHSDSEPLTVMVCGSCGSLAAHTVDMIGAPRCKDCAARIREAPWPENITRLCICGGAPAVPAILTKIKTESGAVKLLPVCHRHAAIAKHIPPGTAVPAKWLANLFRSRVQRSKGARRNRNRRRLKQYGGARKFSTRIKHAQ